MTVTALVSLDDVYDWLNITGDTSSYDAKMQGVVDAATAFVTYQTGNIIPQQYTESRDGGQSIIFLDNPPIISVDSVTEWVGSTGYTLTASTIGNSGAYGYVLLDPEAGKIARLYSGGLVGPFVGGSQNITITYTAGRASVSADVRMAVLEDIRGLFTQTQYGSPATVGGAGSVSLDAWSQSSFNPIGAFPRLEALLAGPSHSPALA